MTLLTQLLARSLCKSYNKTTKKMVFPIRYSIYTPKNFFLNSNERSISYFTGNSSFIPAEVSDNSDNKDCKKSEVALNKYSFYKTNSDFKGNAVLAKPDINSKSKALSIAIENYHLKHESESSITTGQAVYSAETVFEIKNDSDIPKTLAVAATFNIDCAPLFARAEPRFHHHRYQFDTKFSLSNFLRIEFLKPLNNYSTAQMGGIYLKSVQNLILSISESGGYQEYVQVKNQYDIEHSSNEPLEPCKSAFVKVGITTASRIQLRNAFFSSIPSNFMAVLNSVNISLTDSSTASGDAGKNDQDHIYHANESFGTTSGSISKFYLK